jgi:hypothetical protein
MEIQRGGFCQDLAKFLGALGLIPPDATTSQNIWFIYQTSATIVHITPSAKTS